MIKFFTNGTNLVKVQTDIEVDYGKHNFNRECWTDAYAIVESLDTTIGTELIAEVERVYLPGYTFEVKTSCENEETYIPFILKNVYETVFSVGAYGNESSIDDMDLMQVISDYLKKNGYTAYNTFNDVLKQIK